MSLRTEAGYTLLGARLMVGGDMDSEGGTAFSRVTADGDVLGSAGSSHWSSRRSLRRRQRFRMIKIRSKSTRAPPPAAMPIIAPVERTFGLAEAPARVDDDEDDALGALALEDADVEVRCVDENAVPVEVAEVVDDEPDDVE